jgi:hypothetical protein
MQAHQRFAARNGIAAVRSPRFPNMRNRRIVVHSRNFVWDDDDEYTADSYRQEGDTNTVILGCEPDQWEHLDGDYTAAHVAVERLGKEFVWQHDASSDPFQPGSWYTTRQEDPYENRETEKSYHLVGFAPSEEARVHRMLRKIGQ